MKRNETHSPCPAAAVLSRLLPGLLLLVVGTLLGVSTNLAKYASGKGLDPRTLLIWAVSGAALVITTVNLLRGRRPRLGRRTGEYYGIAALIGIVIPSLLMYSSVPIVGAGFVTLSLAFPPLLTYAMALAVRMERFDRLRAAGVLIALSGATYLAYLKFARPDAPAIWIAAVMLAPVILAVGNIYRTARWPGDAAPDDLVPGVLLAAGGALLGVGLLTDIPLRVQWSDPAQSGLILIQIAVLSTQYLLFFVLQKKGGPVLLSLMGSVAAVVGVPVAVLLLGEDVPEGLAVGGVLIAIGIGLVVRQGAQTKRPRVVRPGLLVPDGSD